MQQSSIITSRNLREAIFGAPDPLPKIRYTINNEYYPQKLDQSTASSLSYFMIVILEEQKCKVTRLSLRIIFSKRKTETKQNFGVKAAYQLPLPKPH